MPQNDSLTLAVNDMLLRWVPSDINPGGLRVNSAKPNRQTQRLALSLNDNYTYLPLTRQMIDEMTGVVKKNLPDSLRHYTVTMNVGQRNLSYYINHIDKLPEKYRENVPFVRAAKPYNVAKHGMEGDILALWHSHGRYYKNGGWYWQRPLLFQSIEDTFTMGYILPFLVPMLENAGAYVMLPRERDFNREEVIVDNDTNEGGMLFSQQGYKEMNGARKWRTGTEEGFIYDLPDFRDTENPFENGTYREVETIRSGKPSVAAWYADIPKDGEYAVYVSYKTLPNSTTDAKYTVNYSGGSREFLVNQTMGGSTWIYLGTFPLEEGLSHTTPVVTLTNVSDHGGNTVVTADAVKIGGGMGNIARSPRRADIYYDPSTPEKPVAAPQPKQKVSGNEDEPELSPEEEAEDEDEDEDEEDAGDDENGDEDGDDEEEDGDESGDSQPEPVTPTPAPAPQGKAPVFRTSGLPRYLEGARYWMQWAGFPEYVYSPFHGADDYKDDYTSRGHWVNYLAGGSRVLPGQEGLHIPVDIAFALHSDAGKRSDDSTVGTLGIYYTADGASYKDGTPRSNSRMLTDLIMRQITNDVRREIEPKWTRRSMWDKSYLEARVPEVPTTLIELLSHQNYGDMIYGLDPEFKFTVARAIYKAMAKFNAERKGRQLVIQPLPVHDFAIIPQKKGGHYRLVWKPTADKLEPTAKPTKYIIMERTEGTMGFHRIGETGAEHFDVKVTDDLVHSYRVIAANEGGMAFPSETLALRTNAAHDKPVLVVNGFSRVSAPGHYSAGGNAGFNAEDDFGVPYISDASFTGYQTEMRRSAGDGFGKSGGNYIGKVVAGNSFDYPAVHGDAIADAGLAFVSSSAGAVESGAVRLKDYPMVDLILGKQKGTKIGSGLQGTKYNAFPGTLQESLAEYVLKGGNLFVSGAYVASDAEAYGAGSFASGVLGVRTDSVSAKSRSGKISPVRSGAAASLGTTPLRYSNDVNETQYIVEKPDALIPAAEGAGILLTFSDTGLGAGVYTPGNTGNATGSPAGNSRGNARGNVFVMSVPFESLRDAEARTHLMKEILTLLKVKQ